MTLILIIIKKNLVDSAVICKNKEELEKKFMAACILHISNFSDYETEDIEDILEQGYEKFGNGSINMVWAE